MRKPRNCLEWSASVCTVLGPQWSFLVVAYINLQAQTSIFIMLVIKSPCQNRAIALWDPMQEKPTSAVAYSLFWGKASKIKTRRVCWRPAFFPFCIFWSTRLSAEPSTPAAPSHQTSCPHCQPLRVWSAAGATSRSCGCPLSETRCTLQQARAEQGAQHKINCRLDAQSRRRWNGCRCAPQAPYRPIPELPLSPGALSRSSAATRTSPNRILICFRFHVLTNAWNRSPRAQPGLCHPWSWKHALCLRSPGLHWDRGCLWSRLSLEPNPRGMSWRKVVAFPSTSHVPCPWFRTPVLSGSSTSAVAEM